MSFLKQTKKVGKNAMPKSHKNEIINQKRTKNTKITKNLPKKNVFHTKILLIFYVKMPSKAPCLKLSTFNKK